MDITLSTLGAPRRDWRHGGVWHWTASCHIRREPSSAVQMSVLFVQSCADTSTVCPELGPLWLLAFLCALWEKNHVLLMLCAHDCYDSTLILILLLMMICTSSYHFLLFLSKWTFSHHLWPICLLIPFCTLFMAYLSYPSFVYIYQIQSLCKI